MAGFDMVGCLRTSCDTKCISVGKNDAPISQPEMLLFGAGTWVKGGQKKAILKKTNELLRCLSPHSWTCSQMTWESCCWGGSLVAEERGILVEDDGIIWNMRIYLSFCQEDSGRCVAQCFLVCKDFVQVIGSSGRQVYDWCGMTSSIAGLWSCFRTVFEPRIFKTAALVDHNRTLTVQTHLLVSFSAVKSIASSWLVVSWLFTSQAKNRRRRPILHGTKTSSQPICVWWSPQVCAAGQWSLGDCLWRGRLLSKPCRPMRWLVHVWSCIYLYICGLYVFVVYQLYSWKNVFRIQVRVVDSGVKERNRALGQDMGEWWEHRVWVNGAMCINISIHCNRIEGLRCWMILQATISADVSPFRGMELDPSMTGSLDL